MIGLSSQDIVPSTIGKNWEDVATYCFKILLWHLHGGTKKCSEEHQDNVVPHQISVSHILNFFSERSGFLVFIVQYS